MPGAGSDEPVDVWSQERVDAEFFSIVTDMVGAPVRVVDADGGLAWVGRRTVFGLEQSSGLMPLRFPGQYADDESGMFYNLFRYYDPSTGRYLSPDPLGLVPAPDPMGYPTDPLSSIDPLGLHKVSLPDGSTIETDEWSKDIAKQRQDRHIRGTSLRTPDKSFLDNQCDAKAVLDAFHANTAMVLGRTKAGHIIVRVDNITGHYVNIRYNISDMLTNVFLIKGTKSVSIVPYDPARG